MTPAEQCQFCGRFLRQTWHQTSDESDSWQDAWSCSNDAKHKVDHPEAYGLEPRDSQ